MPWCSAQKSTPTLSRWSRFRRRWTTIASFTLCSPSKWARRLKTGVAVSMLWRSNCRKGLAKLTKGSRKWHSKANSNPLFSWHSWKQSMKSWKKWGKVLARSCMIKWVVFTPTWNGWRHSMSQSNKLTARSSEFKRKWRSNWAMFRKKWTKIWLQSSLPWTRINQGSRTEWELN